MTNEPVKGLLLYRLPPWLWALGIFVGTSIPATYLPEIILLSPDKLLHGGVFFVFSILVFRALIYPDKVTTCTRSPVLTTILITVGYAIFDEVHRYFVPGRAPDPFDVAADALGVALGLLGIRLYCITHHRRPRCTEVAAGESSAP